MTLGRMAVMCLEHTGNCLKHEAVGRRPSDFPSRSCDVTMPMKQIHLIVEQSTC